jgi:hypothetical protein
MAGATLRSSAAERSQSCLPRRSANWVPFVIRDQDGIPSGLVLASVLAHFLMPLSWPHPGTAAVLVDELDRGRSQLAKVARSEERLYYFAKGPMRATQQRSSIYLQWFFYLSAVVLLFI